MNFVGFKNTRALVVALFSILFVSLISSPAAAQGLTGQISGTVTDASGSTVSNTNVNLTNRQSGQTRSTKTNNEGHYVFTELLPGTFSMTVDAPGFKSFEQQEVVVTATERVTVPVALQIGSINETISVSEQVAQIQTESAERSGLITSRQMQEIPLK